jgi:GDPmannose 4,6-dehydratase
VGRVTENRDAPRGPAAGEVIIRIDPRYFRPTEVDSLLGDATKARQKLGWQPRIPFRDLVREMVAEDLKLAQRDAIVAGQGYPVRRHHE